MRKRTIKFGLDNIFWYIIYLLPIILTVVQSIGIFKNFTFEDWKYIADNSATTDYRFMHLLIDNLFALGFDIMPGEFFDIIFFFQDIQWLESSFGVGIWLYFWYFIFCNVVHLMIDFILFIPRLAHKWMNTFTQTED